MTKRYMAWAAVFALAALPLPAQSAGDFDALLDSPAVTWGQTARIVLAAAGRIGGELSEEEAFAALQGMAKLPRRAESGGETSLGGVSLAVMRTFGLRSGLYRLFPTGHYACRELVYLGILQGRSDPDMKVSGERLLHILGRVLDYTGTDREGG